MVLLSSDLYGLRFYLIYPCSFITARKTSASPFGFACFVASTIYHVYYKSWIIMEIGLPKCFFINPLSLRLFATCIAYDTNSKRPAGPFPINLIIFKL